MVCTVPSCNYTSSIKLCYSHLCLGCARRPPAAGVPLSALAPAASKLQVRCCGVLCSCKRRRSSNALPLAYI